MKQYDQLNFQMRLSHFPNLNFKITLAPAKVVPSLDHEILKILPESILLKE
jgi:hypothetical protein